MTIHKITLIINYILQRNIFTVDIFDLVILSQDIFDFENILFRGRFSR